MLIESGFIVSDMLAAAGGRGTPMVNDALLFTDPAAAYMFTIELFPAPAAVNVTVATPEVLVIAVAAVKVPAPKGLTVNVTVAPLIRADDASRTVADTVVLPPLTMVVVPSATATEVGTWGGVPMVIIGETPKIVPVPKVTVARMVAVALTAGPAVNTDVAWPDAFVTAEAGLNDPAVALITEKETLTFGITTEEPSSTVAVTLVVPPLAMVDAESAT